jgi:hypothetical protein
LLLLLQKFFRKEKRNMKKFSIVVALLLLLVPGAFAQLQSSTTVPVTVQVTVQNSISLSESGGSLTIDPTTGVSNSVTFSAIVNLNPGANTVTLYTWFSNAASALAAGSANIPSSSVQAIYNSPGVTSGSGFCNTSPAVGNSVVDGAACPAIVLMNAGAFLGPVTSGTFTSTYSLAVPSHASLPAGNFSGTLNALVLAV